MAYRMVYLRVRSSSYSFGWTSDTDQAAFKEESRRIFQELGWELKPGSNGVCDTVTKGYQDLYLHPMSFSGVMDETNLQPLLEGRLISAETTHGQSIRTATAKELGARRQSTEQGQVGGQITMML